MKSLRGLKPGILFSSSRLALSLWAFSVVLSGLAIWISTRHFPDEVSGLLKLTAVLIVPFPTAGAMIAARQPRNAIGWVFIAVGLIQATSVFGHAYSRYAIFLNPGRLPLADGLAWFSEWSWFPSIQLLVTFLLLLFPNGHTPSPHWRWVAWLAGLSIAMPPFIAIVDLWPERGLVFLCRQYPHGSQAILRAMEQLCPAEVLGVPHPQEDNPILMLAFLGPSAISGLASVAALIARYRHSQGIERQQLKWFTFAGVLAFLAAASLFIELPIDLGVLILAIPLSVAIAILRYRLYDIDILINRTLVYGLLTVSLGLVYFGSVFSLQNLLRALTGEGQSELVTVLSTLTIAALFSPLRRRIQSIIDRRFYRSGYNAAEILEGFSSRLRNEVDLGVLSTDLMAVVGDTFQPESVSLWLRRTGA